MKDELRLAWDDAKGFYWTLALIALVAWGVSWLLT